MKTHYDIVIRNTNIIDGTGRRQFLGDVGITGDKITMIGAIETRGTTEIDGKGLVTCPGFIDAHSHADMTILKAPEAYNLVMQGITTFVGGNCGISLAPVGDPEYYERANRTFGADHVDVRWKNFAGWLDHIGQADIAPNYIPLVGHNTIRGTILGNDYKKESTKEELKSILKLTRESMEAGAFGVSFMLDPGAAGFHAGLDELIEIAKIVKEYNGVIAPHTRHHQNQWFTDSIDEEAYGLYCGYNGEITAGRYHGLVEAVEICRRAGGVRMHMAHLTPAYSVPQPHPVSLDKALAKATLEDIIDRAKDEGLDISYNVLPCEYSIGSELSIIDIIVSNAMLPKEIKEMSRQDFALQLRRSDFRSSLTRLIHSGKIKFGMIHPCTDPYWFDCYRIITCSNAAYQGRTLGEIIREEYSGGVIHIVYEASYEVLFDMLCEDPNTTWALVKDKREYGALDVFLKHKLGIPITDTIQVMPSESSKSVDQSMYGISPSYYNMFIHYLNTMVKERNILSQEEAIHKITGFPAKNIFGITDRGVIKEGAFADIVMLNWDRLWDNRDFSIPRKTPEGINCVMINGKIVCDHGVLTGARAGKILKNRDVCFLNGFHTRKANC